MMAIRPAVFLTVLAVSTASCGGGSDSPTAPSGSNVPSQTSSPNAPVRFFIETIDGQGSASTTVGQSLRLAPGVQYADGGTGTGGAFGGPCQLRSANANVVTVLAGFQTCADGRREGCMVVRGVAVGTTVLTCHDDLRAPNATKTPFSITVR